MTMEEMHEQRGMYVQRVKEAAAEALDQNGLLLESVALTDLDQTDLQYFNPSNRLRRRRSDPDHRGDRGQAEAAQRHRAGVDDPHPHP